MWKAEAGAYLAVGCMANVYLVIRLVCQALSCCLVRTVFSPGDKVGLACRLACQSLIIGS